MYRLNHNQNIIGLLERLKGLRVDYPAGLFFARRVSFLDLINRYILAIL